MKDGSTPCDERRALILAPSGKDGEMTRAILARAEIAACICRDMGELCREAERGAACLIVAAEALPRPSLRELADFLSRQPPWSDLALLVMMQCGAPPAAAAAILECLGSAALLDRPVRVSTLVSAVHAAMRSRDRQYELRKRFEAQSLLAEIVASSDDAIISKTLDGVILTWNAGAERIFGYSADEAIGKPITIIIPQHRLDEERDILARLRRGERIEHFSTVRISKDGRLLDISMTISPLRDSENRVIGASKVARDISVQKRAEQALIEADRRKDEFLATLAHELRNPLAPIRNSLQILRMAGISDPAVEQVQEMMERQVNHMVRLVDDLMELSRITRGKIELRKERVELAGVLRSALEASQPLIDAANHQLALSIPPDPLIVEADPVRLAQVFTNLLNNAAKYTPEHGQIWLSVRRDGNETVIRVRDSGIGIPEEMLHRVFEMFTQVQDTHRRSQGGLGIGLTLVKMLVELHGGRVIASSAGVGKGSEFTVRLPLGEAAADAERRPQRPVADFLPLRILVVDDNQDAADSLGMLLKFMGPEVQVVYDGPTALRAVERFRPDVVLLDLGMPGMDGFEVARAIRRQPFGRSTKLVALTGWGQEEDRRRSRAAGFDSHLMKPAELEALRMVVNAAEISREGSRA